MTEESVFAEAVAIPDPAAREAYLDAACGGDAARRARLGALVAAHFAASPLLDPPASGTRSFADAAPTADPDGTRARPAPAGVAGAVVAGKYKLLQRIGEGGMGEVWMAEQTEPVKRRVAVKLVRADRGASGAILARFEAERQAIALMDHPHIAKLLDAGTTDAGSPFFAMELVRGVPLTDFCDRHRLSVPARLALFAQICGAVQHAHQKGVIHRDLKPSNILVESHGGVPVPKVIDFGLAKAATGLQLTEKTLFTAFGSVMGTPTYMAPEQAAFDAVDVDTRADVYALGVILYELLTGTTPLTRDALKKAALDEVLRLVREQEPPTPSSRVSASDAAPSVAANRQTEPAKLGRFVKGELDWIVLKALAKDRDRRYESAATFARDVERFLAHEPVAAGPPSPGYKVRKFVRRHRGPVAAAALVLLALLLGFAGTSFGLIRADEKRRDAEQARADEADQRAKAEANARAEIRAREQAERRLGQIENGVELLAGLVRGINPRSEQAGGKPLFAQLRERAEQAVDDLDAGRVADPLAEARLQTLLGETLRNLGSMAKSVAVLEKATDTRERLLGRDHPDTLVTNTQLATSYLRAGLTEKAVSLFEDTARLMKCRPGVQDPETLRCLNGLALAYRFAGQWEKALPIAEQAFALRKATLGPDHPDTILSMGNLAEVYRETGRNDQAISVLEAMLDRMTAKLGRDHLDTMSCLMALGRAYQHGGRHEEAVRMTEEALARRRAKLGLDHPDTINAMLNLTTTYLGAGHSDKALPLAEETYRLATSKLDPKDLLTIGSLANLAEARLASPQPDKALPLAEEAYKQTVAQFGEDNENALEGKHILGLACHAAGQNDRASSLLSAVIERRKVILGADHPDTLRSQTALGTVSLATGHYARAEAELLQCLSAQTKKQPTAWQTCHTQCLLGGALLGQKKYADAEPLLVKGYEGLKAREKDIPPQGATRIPEALDRLVELYTATDKPDEAKKYKELRAKYPAAKGAAKPPEKK